MITQVYTAQTPEEAVELARLCVDHVGVTVSRRGLPGEVSLETGREIVATVAQAGAKSVALTVDTEMAPIRRLVTEVRPDILHLCGDTTLVGPDAVRDIRDWSTRSGIGIELMQAIGVTGPESVDLALEFEPYVDWIILDSTTEAVEGIGAAGEVHDWNVSRDIVEATSVSVVLAGGLGSDNVGDAIAAVHPAGVDSLTHTNRHLPDGSFVKDLGAVERFVRRANHVSR